VTVIAAFAALVVGGAVVGLIVRARMQKAMQVHDEAAIRELEGRRADAEAKRADAERAIASAQREADSIRKEAEIDAKGVAFAEPSGATQKTLMNRSALPQPGATLRPGRASREKPSRNLRKRGLAYARRRILTSGLGAPVLRSLKARGRRGMWSKNFFRPQTHAAAALLPPTASSATND
jgi:hypothetical protein